MAELTGQIGLRMNAPASDVIPWSIERITRSHTHHTVVALDNVWCVSAQPGGVKIVRIDSYPSLVWTRLLYGPGQAQAVADAARRLEGRKYNYPALVVIAASFTFNFKTPERLAAWLSNNSLLDCSQLCDMAILEGTGARLFDDEAGLIYPGDFERFTASETPIPLHPGQGSNLRPTA